MLLKIAYLLHGGYKSTKMRYNFKVEINGSGIYRVYQVRLYWIHHFDTENGPCQPNPGE